MKQPVASESEVGAMQLEWTRHIEGEAVGNPGCNMEQIKIVKEKNSDVLCDKFDGAKIRSRAKYLDREETPFSYFLRREKRNVAKSTISELSIDGKVLQVHERLFHEPILLYRPTYIQSGWSGCWVQVLMGSSGAKPRRHVDDAISVSAIHTTFGWLSLTSHQLKAVTRGCFGCLNTPEISGKN